MSDKQGTGFGLSRYWIDLSAVAAGFGGSYAEMIVPQGNVPSGSTDSGNPVKVAGKYNLLPPTFTDGQRADLQTDSRGTLRVVLTSLNQNGGPLVAQATADALAANNSFLYVGSVGYTFNGTSWDRTSKAVSTSRIASAAASTNATSAKASAGTVYTIEAMNTTASVKYLKVYNKASAPTVGTDTPVRTIALAPSNARSFIEFPTGLYFSTGIAFALTGAAADADATALAAGDVVGLNIDYS